MTEMRRLLLPPPFAAFAVGEGDILALAEERVAEGAGTLLWREADGVLALAVVLEPGPPLVASAKEAELGYVAALAALCEALVEHGLPERRIEVRFPDEILYDGARLGGARWQAGPLGEDGLPEWGIFAAELIAAREGLEHPGAFPGSTSLEEEEFSAAESIVESFAAFLKLIVDRWGREGPEHVLRRLLDRVSGHEALKGAQIVGGKLVLPDLAQVMSPARWRDAARGGPQW